MTAEFPTVSTDTVYDLVREGELLGRKVARRWLTTRDSVLRWLKGSSEEDALVRAIANGDHKALTAALKSGKVQVWHGRYRKRVGRHRLIFIPSISSEQSRFQRSCSVPRGRIARNRGDEPPRPGGVKLCRCAERPRIYGIIPSTLADSSS